MKTYYCTKTVDAEPMSRLVAEKEGLVRDITGVDEDGYKVVYTDGYTSWSPKEVFESGYSDTSEGES